MGFFSYFLLVRTASAFSGFGKTKKTTCLYLRLCKLRHFKMVNNNVAGNSEFIVCEQALKRLKEQQRERKKKEALICRWRHVPDATAEPDGCYSPTCHLSPQLPLKGGTSLSEQTPTL